MHALELTSDDEPLLRARRLEHVARASEPTLGVASAEKRLREALAVYRAHGDRDGIATAAFGVGRLLRAQTRFREAVDLADDLLAEVGEAEDKATVVLLLLRGPAKLDSPDALERAARDYDRASPWRGPSATRISS